MDKARCLTLFLVLVSGTICQMGSLLGLPLMDPIYTVKQAQVANCPLEVHPGRAAMFIMRDPLGNPAPRACPPKTYFVKSECACVLVKVPLDKCKLQSSPLGPGWYENYVHGLWITRQCGPGSGFNPTTCDCSLTLVQ